MSLAKSFIADRYPAVKAATAAAAPRINLQWTGELVSSADAAKALCAVPAYATSELAVIASHECEYNSKTGGLETAALEAYHAHHRGSLETEAQKRAADSRVMRAKDNLRKKFDRTRAKERRQARDKEMADYARENADLRKRVQELEAQLAGNPDSAVAASSQQKSNEQVRTSKVKHIALLCEARSDQARGNTDATAIFGSSQTYKRHRAECLAKIRSQAGGILSVEAWKQWYMYDQFCPSDAAATKKTIAYVVGYMHAARRLFVKMKTGRFDDPTVP